MERYDKIIIGAGLYGLYAADFCAKNGEKVLVLEYDELPFQRATYVNQARVHMGYHYPRSYTTAIKSAQYFDLFTSEFGFCIKEDFEKIYAISSKFSWTNAKQFQKFCRDSNIPCKPIDSADYFKEGLVEGSYISRESTFDAKILMDYFDSEVKKITSTRIIYGSRIQNIEKKGESYIVELSGGEQFETGFIMNATYGSINQVLDIVGFSPIAVKYELCEVILCKVSDVLKDVGITVMDGPFFSLMPFGKTGFHSLTSVAHTPHKTSHEVLPTFECQPRSNGTCSPKQLGNCNSCIARPKTSWDYMNGIAKKYLRDDIKIEYVQSLFSIKTVLKASEIDDARPTMIIKQSSKPTFVSVLSGKINTVYDLNETLLNGNQ